MANFANIIEMLKFLGYSLGLGSLTAAIFIFFNNFIKDRNIDDNEFNTLKGFSELVWFGFGLVLLMQFAYYVIDPSLIESGPFLMKIIALLVSAFAGAVMMIVLNPFLVYIPFKDDPERKTWLWKLRRPVFVFGAVGISSWYFAFIINFLPEYGFNTLSIAYAITLASVIIVSILWEQLISRTNPQENESVNVTSH
jgi:NhaP-type Na+/H+ or K+/H+ antiporter